MECVEADAKALGTAACSVAVVGGAVARCGEGPADEDEAGVGAGSAWGGRLLPQLGDHRVLVAPG